MTTLTVKVPDKKQAKMLYEMLLAMKFVKQVEMSDSYDLEEAEMQVLKERMADYKKNPKSGLPLEQVVEKISRKHGFKGHR